MIVTLQTQRVVPTLKQIRAFVEGNEAVDFAGAIARASTPWSTLERFDYNRLVKAVKLLVRRYVAKLTGMS